MTGKCDSLLVVKLHIHASHLNEPRTFLLFIRVTPRMIKSIHKEEHRATIITEEEYIPKVSYRGTQ